MGYLEDKISGVGYFEEKIYLVWDILIKYLAWDILILLILKLLVLDILKTKYLSSVVGYLENKISGTGYLDKIYLGGTVVENRLTGGMLQGRRRRRGWKPTLSRQNKFDFFMIFLVLLQDCFCISSGLLLDFFMIVCLVFLIWISLSIFSDFFRGEERGGGW